MKTYPKSLSIFILSALLNACALDVDRPQHVQYIEKSDAKWQQHLQQIKQIKQYQVTGQIGYISNKKRFSARFAWQYYNPQSYSLLLSSILSGFKLKFEMSPFGMTVSDHKGNKRSASDAKKLLREIIGTTIPLQQLGKWLKGQPDESADYQVGINQFLTSFSYSVEGNVWTVDYLNYHTEQGIPLPKEILLKSHQQTLKIKIDNWKY